MILLAIDPGYRESHAVRFGAGRVLNSISLANDDLLAWLRREREVTDQTILIESMDPFGLRLGRETMDTILWIGRFQEASRAELVPRSLIKRTLCGSAQANDAAIRLVLLDRFGGAENAVGGGACPTCQGKGGWGRKPHREICSACRGTKKRPTGPLYGVTGHCWQALAVAVTWLEVNPNRKAGDALRPLTQDSIALGNEAPAGADSPGPFTEPLFTEETEDA